MNQGNFCSVGWELEVEWGVCGVNIKKNMSCLVFCEILWHFKNQAEQMTENPHSSLKVTCIGLEDVAKFH